MTGDAAAHCCCAAPATHVSEAAARDVVSVDLDELVAGAQVAARHRAVLHLEDVHAREVAWRGGGGGGVHGEQQGREQQLSLSVHAGRTSHGVAVALDEADGVGRGREGHGEARADVPRAAPAAAHPRGALQHLGAWSCDRA